MDRDRPQTYGSLIWRQFRRSPLAVASLVIVALLVFVALLAPVIANEKPLLMRYDGRWYLPIFDGGHGAAPDLDVMMEEGGGDIWMLSAPIPYSPGSYDLDSILQPPSAKHLLGTDGDGRDFAAELVWGARVSLSVGVVAVGIAVLIGVLFGMLAGYFGGWIDVVISRLIEVMICFPTFFLILAVLAFVGPSIYNIMVVIGITGWTGTARLVRGEVLKIRNREFVVAARVAGAGSGRVMWRHILPHALAPVLISASFGVASAILVEAALSFLGFGVPPSVPSWGSMLSDAQDYMDVAWWLTLAPGSAIFITIMAYNLIGEALRDAIDPNLK